MLAARDRLNILNFPIPYQDELIYSTVARYGVHFGLTSPKQLLDEVYDNRKVIATTDLPNQLAAIARHLNNSQRIDAEYLAYNHTLLPLYAPFVPEERRVDCLRLMAGNSHGAIHLALGVAASRVKQGMLLRYCPKCLQDYKRQHGEYYWRRIWQVKGADCCLKHGELKNADIKRHSFHRHEYFAASPANCPDSEQKAPDVKARAVAVQVERLLNRPAVKSAQLAQWTAYYKRLADRNDCGKGRYVKYDDIADRVIQCWSKQWLAANGITVDDTQSCWLRCIFRKHRKSFSYLEHIVALQAFLPDGWNINDILTEVSQMPVDGKVEPAGERAAEVDEAVRREYQQKWTVLVKQHGVKPARNQNEGGAIYAWLYRHNKEWLLAFNKQYRVYQKPINNRVNWPQRDRQTVRQLLKLLKSFTGQMNHPQMTQNWYFSQMQSPSTIEKNLDKMPLCRLFFKRYCEDTTNYQIRRVTRAVAQLNVPGALKRWQVLRLAGLSEERLKRGTREFLTKILGI